MPEDLLRPARYDVAAAAALLADPSRVAMLFALVHGESRPASELAQLAAVTPSTASNHLSKLQQGGMICCERRGRGRFYSLASEDVAVLLEVLVQRAGIRRPERKAARPSPISEARTCYSHLAGRLGTTIAHALRSSGALVLEGDAWALTPKGQSLLGGARLFTEGQPTLGRACLDWTERRPHVGGSLGRSLAQGMLTGRWVVRMPGSRALRVTEKGRRGLVEVFGVRW